MRLVQFISPSKAEKTSLYFCNKDLTLYCSCPGSGVKSAAAILSYIEPVTVCEDTAAVTFLSLRPGGRLMRLA